MRKVIVIAVLTIVLSILCGCQSRYTGAHIVAGDVSGDVDITGYESISFQSTRLYLKDGGEITLAKGMFILFTDTCPICGERREDGQ